MVGVGFDFVALRRKIERPVVDIAVPHSRETPRRYICPNPLPCCQRIFEMSVRVRRGKVVGVDAVGKLVP